LIKQEVADDKNEFENLKNLIPEMHDSNSGQNFFEQYPDHNIMFSNLKNFIIEYP